MDEQKVIEAIERIRGMRNKYNAVLGSLPESARRKSDYNNDVAAFETAIEALEKQLPKKPENIVDAYSYALGEYRIGKCPNCGSEVLDVFGVCLECRQNLDWSE